MRTKIRIWMNTFNSKKIFTIEEYDITNLISKSHSFEKFSVMLNYVKSLRFSPVLKQDCIDLHDVFSEFLKLSGSGYNESCSEIVFIDNLDVSHRGYYFSSALKPGLLSFGHISKNINVNNNNPYHNISVIRESIGKIDFEDIDLSENILVFDPYSAGIISHEVFGHSSESDTNAFNMSACAKFLYVHDEPEVSLGCNYLTDDMGNPGQSVNISAGDAMSESSGNVFFSNLRGSGGTCIRQRNLICDVIDDRTNKAINAFVITAGYIFENQSIQVLSRMKIKGEGENVTLEIPLSEINQIKPNSLDKVLNATICKKFGDSQIVTTDSPSLAVKTRRPLSAYLKKGEI
jgi:hypothetical protein